MSDLQSTDPLALLYPNQSKETVDKLRIGMEARARQEVQPLIKKLQDAEQKQRDNELKTERNSLIITANKMITERLITAAKNKESLSVEQIKNEAGSIMFGLIGKQLHGEELVTNKMITDLTTRLDSLATLGILPATNQDITSSAIMNSGQVDVQLNRLGDATSEEELNMLFADSMESLAIISKELKESDYEVIKKRLEARRDFQKARLTETTANLTSELNETMWQNAELLIRHIASIIPNYNSVAGQQIFQHLLNGAASELARGNAGYWKALVGEVAPELRSGLPMTGRRHVPGISPAEEAAEKHDWREKTKEFLSVYNVEDGYNDFKELFKNAIEHSKEYITELEADNKAIRQSENLRQEVIKLGGGNTDKASVYNRLYTEGIKNFQEVQTIVASRPDGEMPENTATLMGFKVIEQSEKARIELLVANNKITKEGGIALEGMVDTAIAVATMELEKNIEALKTGRLNVEALLEQNNEINRVLTDDRKVLTAVPKGLERFAIVFEQFGRLATAVLEDTIVKTDPNMEGQTRAIAFNQLLTIRKIIEGDLNLIKSGGKWDMSPEDAIDLYGNIEEKLNAQFGGDADILETIRRGLFGRTIKIMPQLTIGKDGEINYFGAGPFLGRTSTNGDILKTNTGEIYRIIEDGDGVKYQMIASPEYLTTPPEEMGLERLAEQAEQLENHREALAKWERDHNYIGNIETINHMFDTVTPGYSDSLRRFVMGERYRTGAGQEYITQSPLETLSSQLLLEDGSGDPLWLNDVERAALPGAITLLKFFAGYEGREGDRPEKMMEDASEVLNWLKQIATSKALRKRTVLGVEVGPGAEKHKLLDSYSGLLEVIADESKGKIINELLNITGETVKWTVQNIDKAVQDVKGLWSGGEFIPGKGVGFIVQDQKRVDDERIARKLNEMLAEYAVELQGMLKRNPEQLMIRTDLDAGGVSSTYFSPLSPSSGRLFGSGALELGGRALRGMGMIK